jgi:hypothetical protein
VIDHALYFAVAASWLIATHLVVEYPLQPRMLRWENLDGMSRRAGALLLHAAVSAVAGGLVASAFASPAWAILYGAAVGVSHLGVGVVRVAHPARLIDGVPVDHADWSPVRRLSSAAEQSLYIAIMVVLAQVITAPGRALPGWLLGDLFGWLMRDGLGIHVSEVDGLRAGLLAGVAVALLIANTYMASEIVGCLCGHRVGLARGGVGDDVESPHVSSTIGVLERMLIVLLAVAGDTTAASFVAAVKAFASGERIRRNHAAAQAMVVGTLSSMLIAFATALAARQLLAMGGVL